MRVAFNTVSLVCHLNDLNRTFLCAETAAGTFRIINMRNVVFEGDCLRWTILLAKSAADTADQANCFNVFAF